MNGAQERETREPEKEALKDGWAGWEGKVVPSQEQVRVGGFRAGGLWIKVGIITTSPDVPLASQGLFVILTHVVSFFFVRTS